MHQRHKESLVHRQVRACEKRGLPERRVLRHILVAGLRPLSNGRPLVYQDEEECVQHQNLLRQDAPHIQQGRAGRPMHAEGYELGLDHDQAVHNRLLVQQMTRVCRLIRGASKDLQGVELS